MKKIGRRRVVRLSASTVVTRELLIAEGDHIARLAVRRMLDSIPKSAPPRELPIRPAGDPVVTWSDAAGELFLRNQVVFEAKWPYEVAFIGRGRRLPEWAR